MTGPVDSTRVAIVGAGIAGLTAAIVLVSRGLDVTVLERGSVPGGKLREVGAARIDAGPTVFTMRFVFEEIFAAAGATLSDYLTLVPADTIARHAWDGSDHLDLFADIERTVEAIGRFSSPAEGQRYRQFCRRTARVYQALEGPFLKAERPGLLGLIRGTGLSGLPGLLSGAPFSTLWHELGRHFHDPRLRQLFGRYATYCGSSPFRAPAVLMLVAHVEREGVWLVEGGMARIAEALARLAASLGAKFRYGAEIVDVRPGNGTEGSVTLASGECIPADRIILNADASAVAAGRLGSLAAAAVPAVRGERSLSAVTWALTATASGFPLARHNVFFSDDYPAEFDAIFKAHRIPDRPTVYVCAQDRGDFTPPPSGPERLFCLINAPATGDTDTFDADVIQAAKAATFGLLERCGLALDRQQATVTTPRDFEALFPGTGGALYGRACHGWRASFQRPGSRTSLPGLYLAGGSVHPGPGVPMAALSGRLAAASLLADLSGRSHTIRSPLSGPATTASVAPAVGR
jgi:1-hydroxycarotenoid 3,4-desaturase